MPNKETEADRKLQEAIDRFDVDCNEKKWVDLGKDVQDDLAMLAEMEEAVCRSASASEKDDTDLAWDRMKKRMDKDKHRKRKVYRLRVAAFSAIAAAAAVLFAVFVINQKETPNLQQIAIHTNKDSAINKKTKTLLPSSANAVQKTAPASAATCVATTSRSVNNAAQLIMQLQNQGYAVDGQIQRTSHAVDPGKLAKVVLPDGTEAYLYASSKLTYPSSFVGDTRDVVLEGEAYFKVTHDASHPFIIHTVGAETRVLGTELNVRAYHGEPLHVALVTGVAEVTKNGDVCRLVPGEGVIVRNGLLVKAPEGMDTYTYALRGFLYADNMPLENVMQILCHWFGMQVVYNDRQKANRRIHFFMRGDDTPQKAAELLSGMGVGNITVENDKFVIK